MKLLLRNADGESVCVSIFESDTFLDLKARLAEEDNIDIDIHDLSIEGRPIQYNLNVVEYFNNNSNGNSENAKSIEYWSCCIIGCLSTSEETPRKQVYHLPNDKERCVKLLQIIKREDLLKDLSETVKNYVICKDHFPEGKLDELLIEDTTEIEKVNISEETCRLCANNFNLDKLLDVFQVIDEIKKCLPIKIEANDNLSKLICQQCLEKLETTKEFIDSCLEAEKKQWELYEECQRKKNTVESKVTSSFNLTEFFDAIEKYSKCSSDEVLSKNNENEYEVYCSICERSVSLISYLKCMCHDVNIFSCFLCNHTCDNSEELRVHLKAHLQVATNKSSTELSTVTEETESKQQKKKGKKSNEKRLGKSFRCDKCQKSFRCKARLDFHAQFHMKGVRAGECVECRKEFPSELCLYKHMLYNHLDPKIFTCENCGKTFRNKSSLTYHLRSHKSFEAMRPFTCDLCQKRFARKNILRDHMMNRHGSGADTQPRTCFQCRECREVFPNTNSAISHMEIHHPDQVDEKSGYSFDMLTLNKLFICEFCDKCYSSPNNLIEHRLQHNPPTRYQCKMCNEEFSNYIELKTHQDGHASDGITDYKSDFRTSILFICEYCEKCLKNYQAYTAHCKTHDKENPYECRYCPQVFRTYELVTKHRSTHQASENNVSTSDSLKPFECQYCEKAFTSGSALTKHIRIHTGEKPFTCRVCNKSFRQSSGLYTHLKVHSNDRPYQCDLCSRAFKIIGDYKQHVRRHSGIRPYSCDVCSKAFLTQRSYAQHKKIHTNEKAFVCEVCSEVFKRSHTLKIHQMKHKGSSPDT